MRTRLALVAVLAALAAGAVPGHAAPTKKPQIVDPAGDALGMQPTTEIVSALWTTTGDTVTTRYRGKKVTTYTPRRLVVTLNLAGAPTTTGPFSYETSATVAGCGTIRFVYTPGTVYSQIVSNTFLWYDCGPEAATGGNLTLVPGISTKIGAKSITWEYPIKALPKTFFKPGAPVSDFRAAVDVVDPAIGLYGTNLARPIDEATGTGVWKLGS